MANHHLTSPHIIVMVLFELGKKIQGALQTLATTSTIDEKALDNILKEICMALLESDVNVKLVQQLRANVKSQASSEANNAPGVNKKRIIQKAIFNELCNLVDPGVPAWKPVKGKPNVVMFVGLQGAGNSLDCVLMSDSFSLLLCFCCCDYDYSDYY